MQHLQDSVGAAKQNNYMDKEPQQWPCTLSTNSQRGAD